MVQIEKLEALPKGRYEIRLSDGSCWRLYRNDVRQYRLEEGEFLEDEKREKIYHECVRLRARKRVLALLERMDRTEQDVRLRLQKDGYEEEAVEDAVSYAKEFHYLDDERYARNYAHAKSATKSRKEIEMALRQKGIRAAEIEDLYGEEEEIEALRRFLRRKTELPKNLSYEEKQKLAASLYRKGFPAELIRKELLDD